MHYRIPRRKEWENNDNLLGMNYTMDTLSTLMRLLGVVVTNKAQMLVVQWM